MEFVIENWYIFVSFMCLGGIATFAVMKFVKMPTDAQLAKVKEWLLYAVVTAEKELGSGMGKLKLRQVYDMFLTKFPWLAQAISFEVFSGLVDSALEEMRHILAQNQALQEFVGNSSEIEKAKAEKAAE